MKYLSHYIEAKQTALFDRLGVFFAFSEKQFNEGKKEGVKYVSISGGFIVPIDSVKELTEELPKIHKEGIAQDIAENGKEAIIKRELANHEAYYTGCIDDTVDALEDYGFTREEIKEIFRAQRKLEPV